VLDWHLDANYGSQMLDPGFTPDPFSLHMVSGGSVNVDGLNEPGCTGYATESPDLKFTWNADSGLLRFYFVADTPGDDTVLVISDPFGNWVCNDDYDYPDVRDPMVDFANADSGQYDIWVASYTSGESVPGTLYITEVAANHP
jgi:hypothetical protein